MSFYYLGSPYSKYPSGKHKAYRDACRNAAVLIRAGVPVFSPIAHSHDIAMIGGIDPDDHDIWLPADRPFMDAAKGLIVLKLPSWDKSYGLEQEITAFLHAGKPVFYMVPGVVPPGVLA